MHGRGDHRHLPFSDTLAYFIHDEATTSPRLVAYRYDPTNPRSLWRLSELLVVGLFVAQSSFFKLLSSTNTSTTNTKTQCKFSRLSYFSPSQLLPLPTRKTTNALRLFVQLTLRQFVARMASRTRTNASSKWPNATTQASRSVTAALARHLYHQLETAANWFVPLFTIQYVALMDAHMRTLAASKSPNAEFQVWKS